jgi:hypothetical protein
MNERIKELAGQAKFMAEETINRQISANAELNAFAEKFAELIVRECMRMCEVTEMSFVTHDCDVEASGAITVKQFIAEHFGVEE